jgi:hypothetical protein
MKEAVKRQTVFISSNNDRHPIPKTRHNVNKTRHPVPNLILFTGLLCVLYTLIFNVELNDATLIFQTL